jgi:hypothetical protein
MKRKVLEMETLFRPGMQLVGSDGPAGSVEDVLYDKDGTVRYLVVRDRGVFANDGVLPATGAQAEGDTVTYPMTRAQIHAADRYDAARHGPNAGLVSAAASRYDKQEHKT